MFYEVTSNGSFEEEWTYAASVRPRAHEVRWECSECRLADQYPGGSFDVVLEEGTAYPDLLQCGAYPLFIVSERVVSVFRGAGIHCFVAYPVGIEGIHESELKAESAPQYYRLEVAGECMTDLRATGLTMSRMCPRCGEPRWANPKVYDHRILEGSWDGLDLFRDARYFPRLLFCTQKIVDLVAEHRLTNFRFKPLA